MSSRFMEFIYHTATSLTWKKKSSAVKRSNIEKALKIWHMGNLTGKCLR